MIKLENPNIVGFEDAMRGMRNPMNSWNRSDTHMQFDKYGFSSEVIIGDNDLDLAERLAIAGSVHAKYRRMIIVYVDVTAPLYWWKEFDTYKIGTVANSCSTMHKIQDKEFELSDFSHEHLNAGSLETLKRVIWNLNVGLSEYLRSKDKDHWWQMIQLLPASYNQKRTVMMNYEVLANIYESRKKHKLDEWREFCAWIENLPYSEEMIMIHPE